LFDRAHYLKWIAMLIKCIIPLVKHKSFFGGAFPIKIFMQQLRRYLVFHLSKYRKGLILVYNSNDIQLVPNPYSDWKYF